MYPIRLEELEEISFSRSKLWGELFNRASRRADSEEIDLHNLSDYIEEEVVKESDRDPVNSSSEAVEEEISEDEDALKDITNINKLASVTSSTLTHCTSLYRTRNEDRKEELEMDQSLKDFLDQTVPVIKEHERRLKETGIDLILNTFDTEKIEDTWLRRRNSSNDNLAISPGEMTELQHKVSVQRHHDDYKYDSDADSMHSGEIAQYVRSSRKFAQSSQRKPTDAEYTSMTIKSFRSMQSQRDALRRKYACADYDEGDEFEKEFNQLHKHRSFPLKHKNPSYAVKHERLVPIISSCHTDLRNVRRKNRRKHHRYIDPRSSSLTYSDTESEEDYLSHQLERYRSGGYKRRDPKKHLYYQTMPYGRKNRYRDSSISSSESYHSCDSCDEGPLYSNSRKRYYRRHAYREEADFRSRRKREYNDISGIRPLRNSSVESCTKSRCTPMNSLGYDRRRFLKPQSEPPLRRKEYLSYRDKVKEKLYLPYIDEVKERPFQRYKDEVKEKPYLTIKDTNKNQTFAATVEKRWENYEETPVSTKISTKVKPTTKSTSKTITVVNNTNADHQDKQNDDLKVTEFKKPKKYKKRQKKENEDEKLKPQNKRKYTKKSKTEVPNKNGVENDKDKGKDKGKGKGKAEALEEDEGMEENLDSDDFELQLQKAIAISKQTFEKEQKKEENKKSKLEPKVEKSKKQKATTKRKINSKKRQSLSPIMEEAVTAQPSNEIKTPKLVLQETLENKSATLTDSVFFSINKNLCNSTALPNDSTATKRQIMPTTEQKSQALLKRKLLLPIKKNSKNAEKTKVIKLTNMESDEPKSTPKNSTIVTIDENSPEIGNKTVSSTTNDKIIEPKPLEDVVVYTPRKKDTLTKYIEHDYITINVEYLSTVIGAKYARKFMKYHAGRRRFHVNSTVYLRAKRSLDSESDTDDDVMGGVGEYGDFYESKRY